jgi:hypothetical protein
MNTPRMSRHSAVLIATISAALLAACGSPDTSGAQAATPAATQATARSSPTGSAPAAASTMPPATVPPIPDGVYRMSLTADAIIAGGGYDMASVGMWTLTIKNGTYTLACRWTDTSRINCAGDEHPDSNYIVETGPVRGDASTMWLASDLAAVAKLNGCRPGECGDPSPYRFAWKRDGTDLVLSDYVGYGGNAALDLFKNFTLVRWKKIS